MKIMIETVPHSEQRYSTCGDWFYDPDGTLHIKVSQLSDPRRENLIAVHELVEVLTCALDGVTQEDVDKFDAHYESARTEGDESEPGDSPDAPYRKQHCLATGVERVLASAWGVCWQSYEKELNELPDVPPM